MKSKDLDKFFVNKVVKIEQEFSESDIYNVTYTNNGHQWATVFRGSLKDCNVIKNAYVKVGYKEIK